MSLFAYCTGGVFSSVYLRILVKKTFVSCMYLALVYWHNTYIWLLFFGDDRQGKFWTWDFCLYYLRHILIVEYPSVYWTKQSSNSWRLELRCLAKLLNKKYTRNPESQSKFAGEQYLLANTRNLWTSFYGFVYCIPTWPINPLSPNTPYDAFLNSPKLSLQFPCKQVGKKFIFHLRQIAVWSFTLFSLKTTYFVWIM